MLAKTLNPMKIRIFRKSVISAAGPALLAALFNLLPVGAWAGAERHSTFVAQSQADTVGGVQHRMVMEGRVVFDAEEREVEGGGSFVHLNNAPPGTPKPIIAFGRWKAREFVSYDHQVGTYGRIEASILTILVDLIPDGGETISGVTLRLICNIGAAGFSTGEAEGFVLTVPGAPFGSFKPLVPALGLTHISTPDED